MHHTGMPNGNGRVDFWARPFFVSDRSRGPSRPPNAKIAIPLYPQSFGIMDLRGRVFDFKGLTVKSL